MPGPPNLRATMPGQGRGRSGGREGWGYEARNRRTPRPLMQRHGGVCSCLTFFGGLRSGGSRAGGGGARGRSAHAAGTGDMVEQSAQAQIRPRGSRQAGSVPPRSHGLSREQHAYGGVPGLIPAVLAQAAVARGAPFAGATSMVRLVGAHLQPAFGRAPLALLLKAVHRLVQGAPCGEDGRWRPLGGDLTAAGFEHRPKILPLTICHENRRARRAPFAHRPLETDHGRRSPPADWTGSCRAEPARAERESDLGLPRFGD